VQRQFPAPYFSPTQNDHQHKDSQRKMQRLQYLQIVADSSKKIFLKRSEDTFSPACTERYVRAGLFLSFGQAKERKPIGRTPKY